jgi:hypothetical protein
MTETLDDFVREGLGKYSDACRVLAFFEKKVKDLLDAILNEKQDWRAFRTSGKAVAGSGNTKRAIWSRIEGKSTAAEAPARITICLWWDSLNKNDHPLIACVYFSEPKSLWIFDYKPKNDSIVVEKIGGKTRLFVPVIPSDGSVLI